MCGNFILYEGLLNGHYFIVALDYTIQYNNIDPLYYWYINLCFFEIFEQENMILNESIDNKLNKEDVSWIKK